MNFKLLIEILIFEFPTYQNLLLYPYNTPQSTTVYIYWKATVWQLCPPFDGLLTIVDNIKQTNKCVYISINLLLNQNIILNFIFLRDQIQFYFVIKFRFVEKIDACMNYLYIVQIQNYLFFLFLKVIFMVYIAFVKLDISCFNYVKV